MSEMELVPADEAKNVACEQVRAIALRKLRAGTPISLIRVELFEEFGYLGKQEIHRQVNFAFRSFGKTDMKWQKDRKHHLGVQIECLQYEVFKLLQRVDDMWDTGIRLGDWKLCDAALRHYPTILRYRKEIAQLMGVDSGPTPRTAADIPKFVASVPKLGMSAEDLAKIPFTIPTDVIEAEYEVQNR